MSEKERKNLLVINELFATNSDVADVPELISLSKTGVYTPAYGRSREIRADHFDQMIRNFNNNIMKTKISVYYSHWDMRRTAAGELKKLSVMENPAGEKFLQGEISWTPNARKSLEQREYKYVSAEIDFDFSRAKDTDGGYDHYGTVLTGIALTNEPAVYDLPAIVFSGTKKFVAHFSESCSNKNTSTGVPKMEKLFKLLGVKNEEEATKKFSSLLDRVKELEVAKESEDFSKQIKGKDEAIASLTKEVEKVREEQFFSEKKTYLDDVLEKGKINAAKHKDALEYSKDKFSIFKDVVDSFEENKALPKTAGTSTFKKDIGKPSEGLADFAKNISSLDDLNIGA